MSRKVTVFGVPHQAAEKSASEVGAREAYKPTAIPGAIGFASKVAPTVFQPTAMRGSPVLPEAPPELSALPGVQRRPVAVSQSELARAYPGVPDGTLQRALGILAGVHLASMSSSAWVSFGLEAQNELTLLIKQRLQIAQEPVARAAPHHLARLHRLLGEVLDAFDRGFLKRRPEKVWADSKTEVEHLTRLLETTGVALSEQLKKLGELDVPAAASGEHLEATALAAEYLLAHVPVESSNLLVARVASLAGSMALHREHSLHLEQDLSNLQDLIALVQDGVLLKLPAVYAQLAGLAGKPSETERFLAAEKLTDILQSIQQRKYL